MPDLALSSMVPPAHTALRQILYPHFSPSATRDEREFPDPDRFDIHRRAARILGFNHGRHRCLGAQVAQLEGRVLLEELLARAPNFESDENRLVRIRSEFLRGFDSLPILLGDRL